MTTPPVAHAAAARVRYGSIRARLPAVTARNPNIQISAKVASHHGSILRKDYHAIAEAVREVAALDHVR